jgi:transcriptional regulator with XRE-family HTH domain
MKRRASKSFIIWLKTEMHRKDWGITVTAKKAGLSHPVISDIMNFQLQPSFETCVGLAKAFDLPLEAVLIKAGYLLSTEDNPIREEIVLTVKRVNDDDLLRVILASVREAARRERK